LFVTGFTAIANGFLPTCMVADTVCARPADVRGRAISPATANVRTLSFDLWANKQAVPKSAVRFDMIFLLAIFWLLNF
jgi:hypothetical protein